MINKIENCKMLIRLLVLQGIDPTRATERYGEKIYNLAVKDAFNIVELIIRRDGDSDGLFEGVQK
jgi:sugar phosphate isomerase/epimerase